MFFSTNRYTRSDYKKQLETGKAIEKIFGNQEETRKVTPIKISKQKKNIYTTV